MRPGDDDWIMVEDEYAACVKGYLSQAKTSRRLLSTAQLFTKHLHYAEYERLKRIAMERGEATRHPVQRPTNPSGTSEIASVRELLRMGADEEHNSSDESAEVTMCDRNLAHLLRGEEARTARSSIAPVTRRNLDSMNRVAADYQGKASTNYSDAPSIKLAKRSGLLSRQDSRGQAGREAKPRGQARQLVHDGSDVVTSAAQDSGGRQASKEARMIAARSEQCNEPAIVPRESSRQDAPHSEQRSSLVNWRKSRVAKRKQQTMPDDEIPMFLG